MYWWKNPIKRMQIKGKPILMLTGEGCQGMNSFNWLGVVVGFEQRKGREFEDIKIKIVIHNNSYNDARDNKVEEIYYYPLCNNDIQYVDGAWVLFAN